MVEKVTSFTPKPTLRAVPRKGGEPYTVEADVLLAADGVKSNTRVAMLKELGVEADVKDTQQAAYRIMLTRAQMKHDPELLELIDGERAIRWIGEKRHIIAYPVSNKTIYNLSTAQPDVNSQLHLRRRTLPKGPNLPCFQSFPISAQRFNAC